ncbi:hypothetical protein [Soonwooa purpurea]
MLRAKMYVKYKSSPRSQYTHEAYSYVWNNPINYWDPTGMEGEEANVGGQEGHGKDKEGITGTANKPKELEGVVVTAYKAIKNVASAGIAYTITTSEATLVALTSIMNSIFNSIGSGVVTLGRWSLWALPLMLNGDMQKPDNAYPPLPAPNMKTEDAAQEETDTNGVNVPDEQNDGGKNAQHKNQKAKESAQGNMRKLMRSITV